MVIPPQNKAFRIAGIIVATVLLAAGIAWAYKHRHQAVENPDGPSSADSISTPENKIPPISGTVRLPDSSRIYVLKKVSLTTSSDFKHHRNILMDGDLYFNVANASVPLTIHTRLLELTVHGKAGFRVTAFHKEDGEEVQVLYGQLTARKSYKSQFPETDTLRANDLLMINSSIDLMEKEQHNDFEQLRGWVDQLPQ